MLKSLFYGLDEKKRERIVNVSIAEFALNDYENSSTNRIVKEAGISKGSLFKYFQSKEELYFYLLDCVIEEFRASIMEKINTLPKDIFQRVIMYSELEFTWYILNPEKFKLIVRAFAKSNTEIYKKTMERYNYIGQGMFCEILEEIDTAQFRCDKKMIINMLKWFLQGFNEEFIEGVKLEDINDFEELRNKYVNGLSEYLNVLKDGIVF